jgi:hypothetical protein
MSSSRRNTSAWSEFEKWLAESVRDGGMGTDAYLRKVQVRKLEEMFLMPSVPLLTTGHTFNRWCQCERCNHVRLRAGQATKRFRSAHPY